MTFVSIKVGGGEARNVQLICRLELVVKPWTYQHEIRLIHIFPSRFERPHSGGPTVVRDACRGGDACSSVHLAGNEGRHVSALEPLRVLSPHGGCDIEAMWSHGCECIRWMKHHTIVNVFL